MSLDTESRAFWDQSDVESELKRCKFNRGLKRNRYIRGRFGSWLTM